jgi:pimeloyl-ACP methyl ester carboxylesterase
MLPPQSLGPAYEYWLDACQRSLLFLDILRERGNTVLSHQAETAPNVLTFEPELVMNGRHLPRPVNYGLVRIVPPAGVAIDPSKPPFVVVDPRAGHGPGIGGMKHDSEIGVALEAGHPCYFIGFTPEPVEGQTIEDVCRAEAAFIEEVARLHPKAQGKPVVIGNCQAGWQTMMAAAMRPDLMGPIMLAGSPLSYWAGERGVNPLRYLGGLLGGTWLTTLTGDLGGGIFDGAWLVRNFESLNPANTLWEKPYNVYSKADTEGPRFIDFETWWGSPVLMNAGEMQWIADNLFVGNKLSSGALRTSEGLRIDLRNVKGPIIVFCSRGDNITPPQQALGWITDLYDDEREIAAAGQTIVYTLHQSIGHLGIFVSGKVATKEHREFTSCMDLIDMTPPGLYEAVITEVAEDTRNPELIQGRYLFRLEARRLDDIRALVGRRPEDDMRFAVAAKVSDINQGLYRTLAEPTIQALANPAMAEAARQLHPNRLRFSLFSDHNPLMNFVEPLAKAARENRQPVSPDNPFLVAEKTMSDWITQSLETWGAARDAMVENVFLATYGSPLLRAAVGLGQAEETGGRRVERDLVREADAMRLKSELDQRFEIGEPVEAALRALCYVNQAEGDFDEREFAVLKQLHEAQPLGERRSFAEFKEILKEQSLLMRLDGERAVAAIPKLLENQPEKSRASLEALHKVVDARDGLSEEGKRRLQRVEALFEAPSRSNKTETTAHA